MRILIDLGRILGGFGDPCGRPGGVQGASWRGLLTGFLARCFPGGLNRRSLRILAPFWDDLGSISREFWTFGWRFSHNVQWIFYGFCTVQGNRERRAETELGQFTSCLVCCSHHCPTCRGGLSEAITMHLKIDFKFWCDFERHFVAIWLQLGSHLAPKMEQ